MPGKQSTGCHQVPAEVSFVAAHQWQVGLNVSRPADRTTSSICTPLPPPCHDTVHLPAVHASLLCMAA